MKEKLRWGLIATGSASEAFIVGLKQSTTGEALAVGSRTQAAADAFGEKHAIPRRYGTYQALLDDPDIDVVYIATPHPMHLEWAVKAAQAGKHILVEKPIGMNEREAAAMIHAARRHDVFLMEAFVFRCHPQFRMLGRLIGEGAIGEVRIVQASLGFSTRQGPEGRYFSRALGGGGILDVGCYSVAAARLIAGLAAGKDFDEPVEVKGCAQLGPTGVDVWAVAALKFPGGILAQLAASILVNLRPENAVRVYGSEGAIIMPSPWHPGQRYSPPASISVRRRGEKQPREIAIDAPLDIFAYEADVVSANIARRQAREMSWDDTLGNMRALDRWRAEVGLQFEADGE